MGRAGPSSQTTGALNARFQTSREKKMCYTVPTYESMSLKYIYIFIYFMLYMCSVYVFKSCIFFVLFLYKFQAYSIIIQHLYTLQSDQHLNSSYHPSAYSRHPSPTSPPPTPPTRVTTNLITVLLCSFVLLGFFLEFFEFYSALQFAKVSHMWFHLIP